MDIQETVGQRIKRLREECGYSQEVLAEKARLSLGSLVGIESGRIRSFSNFLEAIAQALGVTSEYLRNRSHEPQDELIRFAEFQFQDSDVRLEFLDFARKEPIGAGPKFRTEARSNDENPTLKKLRSLKDAFLAQKRLKLDNHGQPN